MRQKLFTVEDNFYFTGREGTVVIGQNEGNFSSFSGSTEVILIRPDGQEIKAKTSGIEMSLPINFEKIGVWFKDLKKEDIPIGTQVLFEE